MALAENREVGSVGKFLNLSANKLFLLDTSALSSISAPHLGAPCALRWPKPPVRVFCNCLGSPQSLGRDLENIYLKRLLLFEGKP